MNTDNPAKIIKNEFTLWGHQVDSIAFDEAEQMCESLVYVVKCEKCGEPVSGEIEKLSNEEGAVFCFPCQHWTFLALPQD